MATVDPVISDIAMMIDLETLSLRTDAFITQVGLCVANVRTREYLVPPTNYWMSDAWQRSRRIDFDTVRWWMKQDREVASGVFEPPAGVKRCSPTEIFHICENIVKRNPGITVWGSPAMADMPWLVTLFQSVERDRPWAYNYERDMMTLYKLLDPEGKLQPPENTQAHDAAADTGWQMEYLFNLMARLAELSK